MSRSWKPQNANRDVKLLWISRRHEWKSKTNSNFLAGYIHSSNMEVDASTCLDLTVREFIQRLSVTPNQQQQFAAQAGWKVSYLPSKPPSRTRSSRKTYRYGRIFVLKLMELSPQKGPPEASESSQDTPEASTSKRPPICILLLLP